MWLSLVLCLIGCLCGNILAQGNVWTEQRDDLSEYRLDQTVSGVLNKRECIFRTLPEHQAAQFSSTNDTCRMYICLLGGSGCRKCRNAKNSSLPMLMVRSLDQLGRTCWRTFQHRVDGTVDFYRNWTDYVNGFGQGEDRNYWMGLEALHQLMKSGDRRVRWEMSLWNESWYWWEDKYFTVQASSTYYRALVGPQDTPSSNIVRSSNINYVMNNQSFSTHDADHDSSDTGSCAVWKQGGWWYNACFVFNPNGRYITPPVALGLTGSLEETSITVFASPAVYPFNTAYSMKTMESLIPDFVL